MKTTTVKVTRGGGLVGGDGRRRRGWRWLDETTDRFHPAAAAAAFVLLCNVGRKCLENLERGKVKVVVASAHVEVKCCLHPFGLIKCSNVYISRQQQE